MQNDMKKIAGAVEDALAYPILTRDMSSSTPGERAGGTAPGGGPSLVSVAQNTIRQVLGWRYRSGDAAGVTAALSKVFLLKDVEGHTEWDYRPQSYTVQADMGEITGAQASIYARAKNALDQSLPLLDGLTSLRPDPDIGDIESMRSMVRAELTQLVGELGQVAGPRVQRVESLFTLLIGSMTPLADPSKVQGHLGQLGKRLGMTRNFVNTIADEQDLTNFLILVDYVNSLLQTWASQKDFFSRGKNAEPFFGTQLVVLSQALASLVDRVQDAYDALDSMFLGPAERQTTILNFFGEPAPITLAELLDWVNDFAANEGPQLLQDSGKDGVVAFRATMNRLEYLLDLTVRLARSPSNNPARAFHSIRAQVPLGDILQNVRLIVAESSRIHRHAMDDNGASRTKELRLYSTEFTAVKNSPTKWDLTVCGEHIHDNAILKLVSLERFDEGCHLDKTSKVAVDPAGTTITATVTFTPAPAAPQCYLVVVTNPDGQIAKIEISLPPR